MGELGTPEVLSHKRLGHELGGMVGVYSHVTPVMRKELMSALTECWQQHPKRASDLSRGGRI